MGAVVDSIKKELKDIYAELDPLEVRINALYARMYKLENAIEALRNNPTKPKA